MALYNSYSDNNPCCLPPSESSEGGDLTDLTPCNAPADLMLMFPSLRPPGLQSSWRQHLSALTQHQAGLSAPAYSCSLFSALFAVS